MGMSWETETEKREEESARSARPNLSSFSRSLLRFARADSECEKATESEVELLEDGSLKNWEVVPLHFELRIVMWPWALGNLREAHRPPRGLSWLEYANHLAGANWEFLPKGVF